MRDTLDTIMQCLGLLFMRHWSKVPPITPPPPPPLMAVITSGKKPKLDGCGVGFRVS